MLHSSLTRAVATVAVSASFIALATYACSSSTKAADETPSCTPDAAAGQCAPPTCVGGNSGIDAAPASCASPGEATPGVPDQHCLEDGGGMMTQTVSQSACCVPGDAGGPFTCPYDSTMFGHEGDDDDCKYHVTWTSTAICEGSGGVEFTVKAVSLTERVDGAPAPVTGAHVHPEVFVTSRTDAGGEAGCDDKSGHESPSTFEIFGESPPGTYSGRIVFDEPGQWTVRFHFNENCLDVLPNSPHGHAAFHITVP
jgi:hypothetical protein